MTGLQGQFQNQVKVRVPIPHRVPERGFYSNKTRVLEDNSNKEGRRASETNSVLSVLLGNEYERAVMGKQGRLKIA